MSGPQLWYNILRAINFLNYILIKKYYTFFFLNIDHLIISIYILLYIITYYMFITILIEIYFFPQNIVSKIYCKKKSFRSNITHNLQLTERVYKKWHAT